MQAFIMNLLVIMLISSFHEFHCKSVVDIWNDVLVLFSSFMDATWNYDRILREILATDSHFRKMLRPNDYFFLDR